MLFQFDQTPLHSAAFNKSFDVLSIFLQDPIFASCLLLDELGTFPSFHMYPTLNLPIDNGGKRVTKWVTIFSFFQHSAIQHLLSTAWSDAIAFIGLGW